MEKCFIKESEKALKLYQNLTIQRDTVQSVTLASLLSKEIDACLRMMNVYNEYAELCQKQYMDSMDRRTKDLNDALEKAKGIQDPYLRADLLEKAKSNYENIERISRLSNMAYEQSTDIYLTVLSRDFKDWDAFAIKVEKQRLKPL